MFNSTDRTWWSQPGVAFRFMKKTHRNAFKYFKYYITYVDTFVIIKKNIKIFV